MQDENTAVTPEETVEEEKAQTPVVEEIVMIDEEKEEGEQAQG